MITAYITNMMLQFVARQPYSVVKINYTVHKIIGYIELDKF